MRSSWYREQALEPFERHARARVDASLRQASRWARRPRRPRWLLFFIPLLILLPVFGAARLAMHLLFFFVLFRIARFARRAYRLARGDGMARLAARSEDDASLELPPAPGEISNPPRDSEPMVARWLRSESVSLPESTRPAVQSLVEHLMLVETQLAGVPKDSVERAQLNRICEHDLRELIVSFQRVPLDLRAVAGAGGASPEEQLATGLATIEGEVVRLHHHLAERDLMSLATHSRYLALKYGAAL